jgi:hypothetical protein
MGMSSPARLTSRILEVPDKERTAMDFSKFQAARLIPATGIKGALDQERRVTSALLAVMRIVPDLAFSLLSGVKTPRGVVASFIEPEFKLGKSAIRPDGLLELSRGSRQWRALVEVKTGSNDLDPAQITSYLDICRDHSFDALITISNQVLNSSGDHPTTGIDQRKLRSTELIHLSWLRVITDCLILSEHQGMEDREQAEVLKELIRFLQSDASGASEFNDMGPSWASVRDGIRSGAITRPNEDLADVVSRYESLTRYAALTLSARLGVSAKESVSKQALRDYKKHLADSCRTVIEKKELVGAITVPGAASTLTMRADLASGLLHCEFDLEAPPDRSNKARVSWVIRQLKAAPDSVLVRWSYKRARAAEKPHELGNLRDSSYEFDLDKSREVHLFRVEMVEKMGSKRGSGKGAFIDSVVDLYEKTYGEVLQPVKAWARPAPKLSETVTDLMPDSA